VAQRTGGRVVRPEELRVLVEQLPHTPVPATVLSTTGYWGERVLGGACVVLLCLEWTLRRRSQLP
jgi:hypothetical protein